MKRKLLIIFSVLFIICLITGCTNKQKQQAIIDYYNSDVKALGETENQFLASYNGIFGENYTDDATAYAELSTTTLSLAKKLNSDATEIQTKLSDDELKQLNLIYVKYSEKLLNAVAYAMSGIEKQDRTLVIDANNEMSEATSLATQYSDELNALVEKYDVVISQK